MCFEIDCWRSNFLAVATQAVASEEPGPSNIFFNIILIFFHFDVFGTSFITWNAISFTKFLIHLNLLILSNFPRARSDHEGPQFVLVVEPTIRIESVFD
jgi:hypothetical protein